MISGGKLELNVNSLRDANSNGRIDENEPATGLEGPVAEITDLKPETEVVFDGQTYEWKDLKKAVNDSALPTSQSGTNISPDEVKTELKKTLPTLLNKIDRQSAEVRNKELALQQAQQRLESATTETERTAARTAVETAQGNLTRERLTLDQLISRARTLGATDSQLAQYNSSVGRSAQGSGSGSGQFRAQTVAPQTSTPAQSQGSGGANQPAPSAITSSPTAGAGAGYGPNMFNGMNPTTAAYANALAMDSNISDGIGMAGKARREGQRLMMLFFFFARMAESGDLGAMYQFIKFITYIIAKDKARQNIQIGSKLIQLQDLSRKATDALLATNADEKNMGEFMKAQQKAKSEVDTISTSQKLMADMLQEFAHVVESMVNSTKNLLDAWGRVLRTASSR